ARIQRSTDASLTETGHTVGTPLYMSPEQCRGEKVSAAADVYSFGCLFYEALSGRPIFVGTQTVEIMQKQITEKPQSISRVLPHSNVPAKLEAIIFKCLQKDEEDRYNSGKELCSALAAVAAALNI